VGKEVLKTEALKRLRGEQDKEQGTTTVTSANKPAPSQALKSEKKKEEGALGEFCTDLTAQAAEGKMDPVIGRDKEVERVMQILARRQKNNPILLVRLLPRQMPSCAVLWELLTLL
jgi:ATP-dependent Clp protease ATP-binding subunit ClpC